MIISFDTFEYINITTHNELKYYYILRKSGRTMCRPEHFCKKKKRFLMEKYNKLVVLKSCYCDKCIVLNLHCRSPSNSTRINEYSKLRSAFYLNFKQETNENCMDVQVKCRIR